MTTSRPAAWADPTDTVPVGLPSGYTIHLRAELDTESYFVLNDILIELAGMGWREATPAETPKDWKPTLTQPVYKVRDVSREHRAAMRQLNRDVVLLWLDAWDLRAPFAPEGAPAMPVTADALKSLRREIAQEIDAAVGAHQQPVLDEIVGLFKGAPAGKAAAGASSPGESKSPPSASARTRRRTSSRGGLSTGTSPRS